MRNQIFKYFAKLEEGRKSKRGGKLRKSKRERRKKARATDLG
jgi:hypothetical protein